MCLRSKWIKKRVSKLYFNQSHFFLSINWWIGKQMRIKWRHLWLMGRQRPQNKTQWHSETTLWPFCLLEKHKVLKKENETICINFCALESNSIIPTLSNNMAKERSTRYSVLPFVSYTSTPAPCKSLYVANNSSSSRFLSILFKCLLSQSQLWDQFFVVFV